MNVLEILLQLFAYITEFTQIVNFVLTLLTLFGLG